MLKIQIATTTIELCWSLISRTQFFYLLGVPYKITANKVSTARARVSGKKNDSSLHGVIPLAYMIQHNLLRYPKETLFKILVQSPSQLFVNRRRLKLLAFCLTAHHPGTCVNVPSALMLAMEPPPL